MPYEACVSQYSRTLSVIRDFVDLVEPLLHKDSIAAFEKNAKQLLPLLAVAAELEEVDIPDAEKERLKEITTVNVKVESDGATYFNISDPEIAYEFEQAKKQLDLSTQKSKFLYQTCLISLISSVECFFSQLLHAHISEYPQSLGGEKMYTFAELEAFSSIEEARQDLVRRKVESTLRGSFIEWVECVKKYGVDLTAVEAFQEDVYEAFLRRNLLVHNGGIINDVYLKKTPKSGRSHTLKKGDEIDVDRNYLLDKIAKLEVFFIAMGSQFWSKSKKIDKQKDEYFDCLSSDIAYPKIVNGDYFVSEHVSKIVLENSLICEHDRLYAKMNYWLSIKKQGRFDEVREAIENEDFSAKEPVFELVRLALLADNKKFYELLPEVLEPNGSLLIEYFKEWPIFEDVRRSRRKCSQAIKTAEALKEERKPKQKKPSKKKGARTGAKIASSKEKAKKLPSRKKLQPEKKGKKKA